MPYVTLFVGLNFPKTKQQNDAMNVTNGASTHRKDRITDMLVPQLKIRKANYSLKDQSVQPINCFSLRLTNSTAQ